ncbi:MAG: hypothetical protein GY863_11455, partial [bacterium]|nr:hypothetical protein [bacterium]
MIYGIFRIATVILITLILTAVASFAQDFPIPENAKLIINEDRSGKWGDDPAVTLKFERTIGDIESE